MIDTRKVVTSVIASVVVVGVVVGLVLVFAIIPVPDFPPLADDPDPSILGTVAFIRSNGDELCLSTIPAGGGPEHEVLCDRDLNFTEFESGWTPDGMLVLLEYGPANQGYRIVDPQTGETLERIPFAQDSLIESPIGKGLTESSADQNLYIDGNRGAPQLVLAIQGESERILLEAEGPADYWFEWARFSPDEHWILLRDSEDRLIVVSATGDPRPRTLVEAIDFWMAASWFIEGYEEGTWSPAK